MKKKIEADSFGKKLQKLREARGITQKELADKLGFLPEYLAKLERDEVLPPVGEIITIARHLSVEPSTFMEIPSEGSAKSALERRKKAVEQRTQDYAYQLLTKGSEHDRLMAFLIKIDPESYHPKVAYQHPGEEFIYVLSGQLKITVGEKTSFLKSGQSIHFDSSKRHVLKNPGKKICRLLVVVYNP